MACHIRDEVIKGEVYDKFYNSSTGRYEEVKFQDITVFFSSITDSGYIKQGDTTISFTAGQMTQLAHIVDKLKHY